MAALDPARGSPATAPAAIALVVDGLEPEAVTPTLTPNLHALLRADQARQWTHAHGVMVTESNPNYTAMLTGTYPDVSGLFSDAFINLKSGAEERAERPSLILVPTLFDAIETQKPDLRTASIMGKEKLRRLFDCTATGGACGPSADNPEAIPVTHVRPDLVGGANTRLDPDAGGNDAPAETATGDGYALDNQVMDIVIARHTGPARPHFTFVGLSMVDGFQHLFGARSPQARAAVANADANIGRLVDALRRSGRWEDTVLFVLADESFQDTGDPIGDEQPISNQVTPLATGTRVVLPDLLGSCQNGTSYKAVSHGGSASVMIADAGYDPYAGTPVTQRQKDCLAQLRARALADQHVTEALYRVPVEANAATLLSEKHPDWRLGSPRVGELFLVARDDSYFANSRTSNSAASAGMDGGPSSLPIPFLVASGSRLLRPGRDDAHRVRSVDIAPTIAWLLKINPPAASEGRVLHEAFSRPPATSRYSLSVRPRVVRRGVKTRFRFRARQREGGVTRALAGGRIRFAHRRVRTDRFGRATITAVLWRRGPHRASLIVHGRRVAVASVRVR